jgi:protein-S-isoprenylcysteine O-methyltransferase Ste14
MFASTMAIPHGYQAPTLVACLLIAGYLSYRSLTPPSPPPERPYHQDVTGTLLTPSVINACRGITLVLWLYYGFLMLAYPERRGLICPFPENRSASIFSWSPYTTVCLGLIFVAAPIRLLAFAQLGNNFTFQLSRPSKLVRTGMYAYVQHPSYAGHFVVFLANIALLSRPRGILGCWMPSVVVAWGESCFPALFVLFACVFTLALRTRVREEEEMLKKEFGEQWEAYHAKTKRFVPGLF